MPEKILNYNVNERIGVGGTGVVRRGRDAESKLDVAVKTLTTDIARDAQTRKRLKSAKKSLETVPPHENLARVLDIVEIGDAVHIIMEYAPGRNLETILGKKSRPMPLESALPLFSQALRGAATAHSKGVLHGNLKPTDIILSGSNQVRVSGFGIASQLHLPSVVRAASRTGKLAYMSPEQIRGENPDERSDVYSLGAILYRLLTGKTPFALHAQGAESRLRQAILQEPAPVIHETMPDLNLSPYLSSIVERALAKDRRKRIPTTREFIRLLQKAAPEVLAATAAPTASAAGVVAASASSPVVASSSISSPSSIPTSPSAASSPSASAAAGSSAAALAAGALAGAIAARLTGKSSTDDGGKAGDDSARPVAPSPSASSPSAPFSGSSSPVASAPPSAGAASSSVGGFVQPTLVRSAVEIENERRLQELRAQQAEQMARAERERAQAAAQNPAASGISSTEISQSEAASDDKTPFQPSPEELKARFAPSPADDKPAAESGARKEEKKRRAVLPWLIVGAAALGGGIYYFVLKNAGFSGDASQAQREISSDEIERRYDSLTALAEKAPFPSDDDATTPPATNDGFSDDTAANADVASPEASARSFDEEKPRIPDNAEQAKISTPPPSARGEAGDFDAKANSLSPKTEISKATKDRKPASSAASKDASASKDAASASRIPVSSAPAVSASRQNAERSQSVIEQSGTKEQSAAKEQRPTKEKATANAATQPTTNKTTASKLSEPTTTTRSRSTASGGWAAKRSASQPTSEARDNEKAAQSPIKSGSLAKANAQSAAEREAARERVRQQYASHLRRKATNDNSGAPSSSSPSSPALSSRSSAPATTSSGKERVASAPRTNREDSYAPERNPVESPNALAPEAKELESAARKAKNLEPYLILRGHVGTVRSVTFSPDGKLIASGGDDKTVKIWDAATGTILRSLRGHLHSVTSVFFSPDGKTLMSGGKDKTVRVWDAATGEALQSSPGVSCEGSPAAFSPDGKFLATTKARVITVTKMQP